MEEIRHATRRSSLVHGRSARCRHPDLDALFLEREAFLSTTPVPPHQEAAQSDYRQFMLRELLIWLVGVPVPIAAIIGFIVF
jgi:hypothetical protein